MKNVPALVQDGFHDVYEGWIDETIYAPILLV